LFFICFEKVGAMKNRLRFLFKTIIPIVIITVIIILLLPVQGIVDYFKFTFFYKNDLVISLSSINKQAGVLTADPSNKMFLRVEVRNSNGSNVSNIPVNFSTDKNLGEIYPSSLRTDKYGEAVVAYIPTSSSGYNINNSQVKVNITARIYSTPASASMSVSLIKPPVVLIHGYQEHSDIFADMKLYLSSRGFDCIAFDYKSEDGVIAASRELSSFLENQRAQYLLKGIQVNKFDIIAHSMGGLVARHYTGQEEYLKNNDVNKIIFVSVPHRGSYWAEIGKNYFDDQGVRDLMPESTLLTSLLPGMSNKGLNKSIQVGSILGQYDEVVASESASLDEWNIKTEVFNVGKNNLTMGNILDGSILEASNHKNVLFNKKVFEKIEEMLNTDLPYPATKSD
jgi:hypothetical protein